MSPLAWSIAENVASRDQILVHLQACDAHFHPRLSCRVDLRAYATKIHQRARRIEAWGEGRLVGLLAEYFAPSEREVFITNMSVELPYQGGGVASSLIARSIEHAAQESVRVMRLRVSSKSVSAIRLYEKHGFIAISGSGLERVLHMQLTFGATK